MKLNEFIGVAGTPSFIATEMVTAGHWGAGVSRVGQYAENLVHAHRVRALGGSATGDAVDMNPELRPLAVKRPIRKQDRRSLVPSYPRERCP